MPRILVVDDSPMDRLVARRLLEKDVELLITDATDGADALRQIEQFVPDAIVTDLQMQPVNGMQLVETVRRQYPYVPVVLMTAHGSEDVAARALQAGAANYVPKNELARHLLETVKSVLAAATTHRKRLELMSYLDCRHLEFLLDTDNRLIPSLVDQVQQTILAVGVTDDAGRLQLAMALEEALLNALYHGNLELTHEQLAESRSHLVHAQRDLISVRREQPPYNERRIHVTATIDRQQARFVIRDEGPGFDLSEVPDPTDPANLTRSRGRGLMLINTFMDEVTRNSQGNEICLVKRWANGHAAPVAASVPSN